ncbi:Rieske (2Fe-2S) protein [Brevibacillus nitrificans]|uniref:Rieske (2Fe-2S) protein n=1 Tax=Brevibacillus nitrificans TaxID=651560 RepID=A0A3M8CXM7_9BACL|nr:Rieske (2Fe-2S) protein [Brevibacillus nitrificans]MED1796726.1 Rieske (2Fe-2S) protein [Brevibacillus nitrificans]RNB80550.1 Rieske (2Fe-2S) protein [Brevibacillus nitrificans]
MEHYVCEQTELEERKMYYVALEGLEIGVILVNDQIHAIENTCPHFEGPVCLGNVSERVRMRMDENRMSEGDYHSKEEVNVVCPWHGFEFDIKSGECIADPQFVLRKFNPQVKDGKVYITI